MVSVLVSEHVREKHSDEFFFSFGHLRISGGFLLLHKKGAFGVLCSLNKGVLLILSRTGKINFQTDRAILYLLNLQEFQAILRTNKKYYGRKVLPVTALKENTTIQKNRLI